VKGGPPLCLSAQVSTDYVAQLDFTVTSLHEGDLLGKEPVNYIHLRRAQIIDDAFVDRIELSNFLDRAIDYWVEVEWACDFADVFEIRGARRLRRGRYKAPLVETARVVLSYEGLDGNVYTTEIGIEGVSPERTAAARGWIDRLEGAGARLAFHLEPGESVSASFVVRAARGDRHGPGAGEGHGPPLRGSRPFEARARETSEAYSAWARSCTGFESSHDLLDGALEHAVADLKALKVHHFGLPVVSAGIPWYTCPFGRDALITGFESLLASPEIARNALRFLAKLQGTRVDPSRDEEPGKIPHEIRFGEMALAGEVPHTPYYGSVDATPLFLVLLTEYWQWTADRVTVEELLPAAEAALGWLERHADRDGDGLVEYERQAPRGLRNQGWKDSHDGVPFATGRSAEPPVALVEVQGYAADAWRRMARLYRHFGRAHEAVDMLARARAMTQHIDEKFWMPERSTYAIALDREKRQVDAVTSNPGHLLFSRAVTEGRARDVARSLLGPAMWSGWGIRTLAKGQPAYNPLSYHNGTVWPHDNAMAAMGLAYYGLATEARKVFDGMWATAQHFRDQRLPELFCGLDRDAGQFPVHYPVACSPQAWASGAWFLLLRATLGLFPDAPRRTLYVSSPQLPLGVDQLILRGLVVGDARVTLTFTRGAGGTFVAASEVEGGPLRVRIDLNR
jgi:glycogen debranching enzyme